MRDDTDVSMLTVVGLIMCCVVNVIVRTLRRVLSLGDWVTGVSLVCVILNSSILTQSLVLLPADQAFFEFSSPPSASHQSAIASSKKLLSPRLLSVAFCHTTIYFLMFSI